MRQAFLARMRHLYEDDTPQAHRFRYALLIFDLGTILFIAGFSAVFVSFGAAFGGLGSTLLEYQDVITRVLGAAAPASMAEAGASLWL